MSEEKDPAAVALGRKGGANSRKNLSDTKKKALAQKAARARWDEVRRKKAAKKNAAEEKKD